MFQYAPDRVARVVTTEQLRELLSESMRLSFNRVPDEKGLDRLMSEVDPNGLHSIARIGWHELPEKSTQARCSVMIKPIGTMEPIRAIFDLLNASYESLPSARAVADIIRIKRGLEPLGDPSDAAA